MLASVPLIIRINASAEFAYPTDADNMADDDDEILNACISRRCGLCQFEFLNGDPIVAGRNC